MKIFATLLFLLCSAVAVVATTTSQSESAQQSIIITQSDVAIHSMADDPLRTQSNRWLSPLIGLKTFTEDVGARVTLRPRLKARNEGTLGQAPWYGMAFGLACTTLAALMLG
ncbi:hypothetical protein UA08_07002 [Talaromyces atroroseus]|uniref:Uncharacterized protein n=1 Tax=Talaromyces atroroseus TaxID=1441469 RepID=A0A225AWE3_TALAT|nr:hypothetical protein UA08_07002 [Talaromyces atroroseus]OKL57817.1 hypothetical protein UA08_07002 [Talaromyces atroroseus]